MVEQVTPREFGVQKAAKLNALFDEKLNLTGGTMTGDLRINGTAGDPLFLADVSADRVGISNGALLPTDGLLHIQSASAGTVAANTSADELVIEGDGSIGMSFLNSTTGTSSLYFGDPNNNNSGFFQYVHASSGFLCRVTPTLEALRMLDGSGAVFNEHGDAGMDFRVESDLNTHMFFIDAGNNRAGFGLTPTDGLVHIQSGSAGVVTANGFADELVIEGATSCGMSFLSAPTGWGTIYFGDSADNNVGAISYGHSTDIMAFNVGAVDRLYLNSSGAVFNDTGADLDFRVESDLNTHMFFVDAGNNSVHIDNSLLTGAGDGDLVMANDKYIRFIDNAGTTSANAYITLGVTDNMAFSVPATSDVFNFKWANGTARIRLSEENSGGGLLFVSESSADHAAPGANGCKIYTKDNGSGKTQLIARFNTGAVQVLATEP